MRRSSSRTTGKAWWAYFLRLWNPRKYRAFGDLGNTVFAQTAVVNDANKECENSGVHYLECRINNEKGGEVFNEGLYLFKTSFGVGGVAHEFYEVDLEGDEDAQER